jgi:hypothetical protein
MREIQPIIHHGRVAALVVAGQAIIPDALPSREQATVKGMCLYALEVAEGRLPGPYSDAKALAYARAAEAKRN